MIDSRKLEIVVTTFNRFQYTIDSFKDVLEDSRISSVSITDDCSTDDSYTKLYNYFHPSQGWALSKVKLFRNEKNLDCYTNKRQSALNATNDWIIVLDSDNKINKDYLDAIFAQEWKHDTILAPSFLKPAFDFRKWEGLTLTKDNVAQYANTSLVDTSLNAFNLFINRSEYLRIWDGSINPGTFDSLYFSYCWLKAGNKIHITPNMHYDHRLHEDKSNHFSTHQHKYVGFFSDLMNKIRNINGNQQR